VTGVQIPTDDGRAAFRKFARTTYDLAILNVACGVRFDDERAVSSAKIVVGERPSLAVELIESSRALVGRPLDEDSIAEAAGAAKQTVDVRSDPRGSAEYRRHLTEVLVRRCLTEVAS
jgi:carbon-monoxide dehydrogenase medium subunit